MGQRNQNILPLTAVEYFAGIGLVRLGLENAGWQIVFANDFSPEKQEMYRHAFPDDVHPYSTENVFDLDPDSIPPATLATSSFPCTDLSLAGNRNGIHGTHSSAFWGFVSILAAQAKRGVAPPLILLENVTGWLTSTRLYPFGRHSRKVSYDEHKTSVRSRDRPGFTLELPAAAGDDNVSVQNATIGNINTNRGTRINRMGSVV